MLKIFFFFIRILLLTSPYQFQNCYASNGDNKPPNLTLHYGPEWTFTNTELLTDNKEFHLIYLERIVQQLKNDSRFEEKIESIELKPHLEEIQIMLKDGGQIKISTDAGVLEVAATEKSLIAWTREKYFYQQFIFDNMKLIGLQPHEREGAGHINIGLRYLQQKNLLEAFIIDFYMHPGLGIALNTLADNSSYAKHLEHFFDHWGIEGREQKVFLEQFKNLRIPLQLKNFDPGRAHPISMLMTKLIALGIRGVKKEANTYDFTGRNARLEMRQSRPQASFEDYLKMLEIFEARIDFLEAHPVHFSSEKMKIPKSGWTILGQFADYIEESGLSLKRYKSLLPQVWRNLPEVNYDRSLTFHSFLCKSLF